jgi:hypothetical protein
MRPLPLSTSRVSALGSKCDRTNLPVSPVNLQVPVITRFDMTRSSWYGLSRFCLKHETGVRVHFPQLGAGGDSRHVVEGPCESTPYAREGLTARQIDSALTKATHPRSVTPFYHEDERRAPLPCTRRSLDSHTRSLRHSTRYGFSWHDGDDGSAVRAGNDQPTDGRQGPRMDRESKGRVLAA